MASDLAALIEGARRAFRDGVREGLVAAPDWSPPPGTTAPLAHSDPDEPSLH
jgi:hypothetical protein